MTLLFFISVYGPSDITNVIGMSYDMFTDQILTGEHHFMIVSPLMTYTTFGEV